MGNEHTHGRANAMRYKHDCDKCKPLGEFGSYDLYFCGCEGWDGGVTVIGRFGDEPEEYSSGLELAPYASELAEAKKRAIEAGYLK